MNRINTFFCPTRLLCGADAHRRLPEMIADQGARRVFLVIDPALADSPIAAAIDETLRNRGIALERYTDIRPDPDDVMVASAFEGCRAHGADAIVTIGGGSTMDVAKAVAILSTNGGAIGDYEGVDRFSLPPLPVYAVPTTAGTGSEVSGACVITDHARGVKMAIRHAAYCPAKVAILDPLAVASMPPQVAAHAGLDAFVHAFESYLSKLATPFSDALNIQAMTLIAGSIRAFFADRGDTGAALDMLSGSSMAAMSFGVTGLGNVHCMALPLGALFHVPHGLANAICLPAVAAFNQPARRERYLKVAELMGVNTDGLGEIEGGECAVAAIRQLCVDLSIPPRLRDVGVREEALPELAKRSFSADYNRWNPRYTSEEQFLSLFSEAY
ncbi:iron-containing alcohol dehydrogenase [Alloalcanivorax sp. C16-2]|uniref:iron-containing alcohol dehydrogenase n=1 Tax=Alloalcanivorax sp. C16-2 TaxID=3390052 RepID=UPI00397047C9